MSARIRESNKNNHILKKHVAAIHIGAKLTLLQRKLVNALLYNAYDELLTAKQHTISASVLCEMIGFDSKNVSHLKAALKGLMETVVEFDVLEENGRQAWEAMVLLPYAKIADGTCTYRYERSLAEKLYHPDVYSKINLSVLREMNSTHALVLYENCHRYVDIGHTAWWDVDIFRKLMAVDMMPSYKPFKALNRNVIQPAMKEVNKLSNIQVEMETRVKGRSVTGLRFLVKPNRQLSLVGMEEEDKVTESVAYKALIDEGVSKTLARHWVIENGEEYVFDKLDLANDQASNGKIRSSKVGFLKSAIEGDFHNEKAAKKKALAAVSELKHEREQLEAKIEALQKQQREAETAYRWACAEMIEKAFSELADDEQAEIKRVFISQLSSRIYVDAFKRSGWKDRLNFSDALKFWSQHGLALPSPTDWARGKNSPSPEQLKLEVSKHQDDLKKLVISV